MLEHWTHGKQRNIIEREVRLFSRVSPEGFTPVRIDSHAAFHAARSAANKSSAAATFAILRTELNRSSSESLTWYLNAFGSGSEGRVAWTGSGGIAGFAGRRFGNF